MFLGFDYLLGLLVDRAGDTVQEPIRVRRALAQLRGAEHSLYCAISDPPAPGDEHAWRDGLAWLEPGRLRFTTAPAGSVWSTFDVLGVIETRIVRRCDGPGPRRHGVAKLQTATGVVYWAHPTVLRSGEAILLDQARSSG